MSQYMLNARRPLVAGVDFIIPIQGQQGHRARQGRPEFESNLSKAKAKRKVAARGIRYDNHALEYYNEHEHAWIPAVYHCRIRDRLLAKSKTCAADVYTHPRARGIGTLDQTAFLQSQKHWNLERYDGWTGVEVLFEFDKVKFKNGAPNPSYEVPWLYEEDCIVLDLDNEPLKAFESIPLTISFAVEGALMEAIIRYDERISIRDFWARLPGTCGKGPIIEKHALNERRNRFRLANCVSSWGPPRKGCPAIRSHLESLLTPEMKAANTTRGLRKLSKAEQDEAKKGNAGRHMQNAAGWAKKLRKDGQGGGIPAPKRVRTKEKRNQRRNPRAIRPRPVVTPQIPVEAVWDPNLDPQLMDLDGFGPLPGGGATSHASMQTESMMEDQGYGPLPVGGATGYANMRTESMLEDEEPNPFPDLIDWSGEGD